MTTIYLTTRDKPAGWASPDRQHPPAHKFRALSDGFYKLAQKFPEGQVDMRSTALPHICETPGCFAGWSAAIVAKSHTLIDFSTAATLTAQFLGFENMAQLERWAALNPSLWGNFNGNYLFEYSKAFMSDELIAWAEVDITCQAKINSTGDLHRGYITLTSIADWLAKVAGRLEALEQKEEQEKQEKQQKANEKFISTLKQDLETVPDPVVLQHLPSFKKRSKPKLRKMYKDLPCKNLPCKDLPIKPNFKKSR